MHEATPLNEIPGTAAAEDGIVILDGPNGVAVSMTPDCADGTAQSLKQAAVIARQQQLQQS